MTSLSQELTEDRADHFAPAELAADVVPPTTSATPARPGRTLASRLRATTPLWIWAGVAVAVAGFVLIAVCWGQVAGESQVYLQLPYVVSAGLVGLGLVMVGLTVVNIATRARDAAAGERQVADLIAIIEELSDALAEQDRPR